MSRQPRTPASPRHENDAKLDAVLSQNLARELKNGNPDILYHGTDTVDYSTTLTSEYDIDRTDRSDAGKGVRQKLREQRAMERAYKKMQQTEKVMQAKAQEKGALDDEDIVGKNTGRLVSSREFLAQQKKPEGAVSYADDPQTSYWKEEKGKQSFGRTAAFTSEGH